jgi:hypothetical protein
MLDKTKGQTEAETVEKGLGVGVRFACTVGNGRQIEMTAGVPLDWESQDFNTLMDKLAGVMDRQALRYELHDRKEALAKAERDLMTNRQQLANYEQQCQNDWERRGKQGDFRMSENQNKQALNFKNTEGHLSEMIRRMRVDIEEVERKCR